MKKTISILLCLLLILSSVSYIFAVDWSTTDSNNLQAIKNSLTATNGAVMSVLGDIGNSLYFNNIPIARICEDIANALFYVDGNTSRSITWWLKEAVLDLDSIKDALTGVSSGSIGYYLQNILGMLSYSDNGTLKSWLADMWQVNSVNLPMLSDLKKGLTNTYLNQSSFTDAERRTFAHLNLVSQYGSYSLATPGSNGTRTWTNYSYLNGSPLGNIAFLIFTMLNNQVYEYGYNYQTAFTGYNVQQSIISPLNINSQIRFTPSSAINGIYSYLNALNIPLARLAYVHASDEEISAREKAEANQTAVVNNFIDSNGSGAAPASNFGNVASMSAGYTSNMNTNASASGIWNIFDSNNFGWFSQETANQLDTTTASTRKGYSEFETPLLDKQIEDIYKELGVDVND